MITFTVGEATLIFVMGPMILCLLLAIIFTKIDDVRKENKLNEAEEIIKSMSKEARNILSSVAYELATGTKAINTMDDKQKDIFLAIVTKMLYEPVELDSEDENEPSDD